METVYIGNILINDIFLGSQRMDDTLQNYRGIDQNVKNFVNATGITDTQVIGALDTMVIQLKNNNLWNKLDVLYPFVGGTANTNKFNLVNTGSYTIAFNGSWTYNSNGITGNASNTYANTGYSGSVTLWYASGSMFNYSRTTGSSGYDIGVNDLGTETYFMNRYTGNNTFYRMPGTTQSTSASFDGSGFFMGNSRAGTQTVYKNGTQIINVSKTATSNPSIPYYLGANNFQNTSANEFTNRNYALAGFGRSFDATEASTFYTIVQNFQTALGRQV